jgi:hypothetical protein
MTPPGLNVMVKSFILQLVQRDILVAKTNDELRKRLAKNGYGFRDTRRGRFLVTLPHQVELFHIH